MDLTSITRALRAFVWFLGQISSVGGIGSLWFWLPFLVLVVGLIVTWRTTLIDRRLLWILLVLPALWIVTGLLGGFYWVDGARVSTPWVPIALQFNLISFLLIGLISIFYLKNARGFAGICFVINLYFMLTMYLLPSMAVTGDWL
jgi:hypothetical protein